MKENNTGSTNNLDNFTVTVYCTKSITLQSNAIPTTVIYKLNPNTLVTSNLSVPLYAANPAICTLNLTYSV